MKEWLNCFNGPWVTIIVTIQMAGWMTYDFTSFLTVFQSYQDDVWMIMKGCVQWNSVYGWEDFSSSEDQTRSTRSVGQRLTHWATGAPLLSRRNWFESDKADYSILISTVPLLVWGQNPERKVMLNILGTSWQPVSIWRKLNSEQYLGGCQLEIFDLYGAPSNRR